MCCVNVLFAVMSDIVATMFSSKFMSEILRPQEIFARQNMRIIFDKLVHVSIMRLNAVSMDKLYDLMVMAVKYQILFCSKPKELLLVTYNHLDSIRKLLPSSSSSSTQQLVDNVHRKIEEVSVLCFPQYFLRVENHVLAVCAFFESLPISRFLPKCTDINLKDSCPPNYCKFAFEY